MKKIIARARNFITVSLNRIAIARLSSQFRKDINYRNAWIANIAGMTYDTLKRRHSRSWDEIKNGCIEGAVLFMAAAFGKKDGTK